MGKTSLTAFFAAALTALTVLTLAAPAEAGRGRGGYGNHGNYRGHGGRGYRGHGGHYKHGYRGGGDAVAAGIIGLGVGALIGSALTPRTVYVAPPPRYAAPVSYGPQAWSPDWYSYCYSRYRTFNPNSGTFIGYDGYEHFCR